MELIAGVRKRPGMYVGDTDEPMGLHSLLWELLANVIDEHLAGHARTMEVTLLPDRAICVRDDGRGIPLDYLPEILLTRRDAPTHDGHAPHVHLGPGIGLAPVSALSSAFEIEVERDGRRWHVGLAAGRVVSALRDVGPTERHGTTVRLTPDPTIFAPDVELDASAVDRRLAELAAFFPDLTIHRHDERPRGRVFSAPAGARHLLAERPRLAPPLVVKAVHDGVLVEVALAFQTWRGTGIASYVNVDRTLGGSHHEALTSLLRRAVGWRRPRSRRPADVLRDVSAVLHVSMTDPKFAGPTRDNLTSDQAAAAVIAVVSAPLDAYLDAHPEILEGLARD